MTKVLGKDVRSITAGTGVTKSGADDNPTLTVTNVATADALSTARTIGGVSFDGSANIDLPGVNTAGNQNTTGSAATLTTARTIGGVSFDGSANIDLPGVNTAGNQNTTGSAATLTTSRSIGGVPFDGSANINLPGVNTSGTQDTSGNAATATVLATPRNIGGVSFDGSANITLPGVNTTGTQDTSGNASTATALATARTIGGVSFDGSANINLPGVNATGNQNTTGSAATLTTARTIGGVSFDGSANINLPGVNTAGNQNTSGNAATATTLETARTIGGVSFNGSADIVPNIVTDTTPQLGGNLDVNGNTLTSTSNGNIEVDPNGSGLFKIKGNSTAGSGSITLNCEQNSHGVKIQGPAHSAAASYTLTLPDNDGNADQVIKSDGSGNLAFVDQIKTIQAELTISDAASAGDVIVYESANSRYRTAGESTTSASVTQTSTSIDYLGTTSSSEGLGQAVLVPAYSNKILQLTYESGSYYYRWATLAANGSVTISSTGSMPSNSDQITGGPAFLVASNKIALIGSTGSVTYYNIGTINTSTGAITWGTNATLYSASTSWDSPSSITYDDNDEKWILVGGDNIRALTYNSSNDTFTVGTAATVGGSHTSVAYDPVRNAGVVVYTSGGSNYCKKWTSSNGSITLGSAVAVTNNTLQSSDITGNVNSPAASSNPHIFYIPNRQKFLMIYQITFNDGFNNRTWPTGYNSVTIEANGTLTVANKDSDAGGDVLFLSASIVAGAVDTDTNTLVYFCNGSYNSDRRLTMGRLTMASNGSTTSESHTTLMSHSNTINPGALIYKSAGQLYGFTRYGQSAGGISELDGEFYGIQNTVTQTNIENTVVGIAEESISAGASGTVNLMGGIDRNQSSLTTGATYYLTSNGTLNSTADSYNVKVGVAVSATEILLEHSTGVGVESVSSGTGLTGGGSLGNVTLSLENTGVTAATYGSATTVPQITVDGQGRVTSASNVTVSASPTGYSSSGDDVTISADADNNSGSSSIIFQLDGSEFARFQKRWDNGLIFGVSEIPTTGSLGGTELTLLRSGQTGVVSISNAEPNAIFGKPSSQNDVIHIKSGTTDVGAIGIIKDNTLTNRGMYLRGGVITETVIRLEASTQALTPAVQSGADYAARSNNTTDLGLSDARWKDLYMGNDILVLDSLGVSRFLYDKGSDQLGSRALNYMANVVDAVNFKVNGAQGSDGQVLTSTGSGVAWEDAAGGGGTSVTVSDTAPSSPSAGDLWWSSSTLAPYIYYADGSSNQWVEFATRAGGLSSIVADTTPQLGGSLDVNGQDIVTTSNGDIDLDPNGSGVVVFKGNATKGAGQFKLNCENNSHGITIKGPPHSAAASYTLTLPNDDGDADQVLKTDGSGNLAWVDQSSGGGGGAGTLTAIASGALANGDMVIINSDGTVSAVGATTSSAGIGSEVVFESASIWYPAATFDSNSSKVVIAYEDIGNSQYGTAVVGTVSGNSISFGTPVVFESAEVSYVTATFDSNSNKVVIGYRDHGNSNRGTAIVGTVSGTSISFGSPVVFNTGSTTELASTFDSNANKVVFAYRDGGNSNYGMAIVGTVSGTSISFGTETVYYGGINLRTALCFDSTSNSVIVAYRAHTHSQIRCRVGTISGTTISFPSSHTNFNSNQTIEYTQLVYDPSNDRTVLIYRDDGNSNRGTAIVGTVSGTTISFGSEVIFNTSASSYIHAHFDSGSNKVIIAYQDAGNSSYGTVIAGTVSDTSISFGSTTIFNSGNTQAIGTAFDSNANKSVIAYVDYSNSSYGTGIVGQLADSSSTNLTATNYIGIADAAYSNSATATIQLVGSVDDAQSGLTAGQAYYVQTDGSLSTDADSPSVFAGTAVAATKLIVKG